VLVLVTELFTEDSLLPGRPVLLLGIEIEGMEGMGEEVIINFTLTTADLTVANKTFIIIEKEIVRAIAQAIAQAIVRAIGQVIVQVIVQAPARKLAQALAQAPVRKLARVLARKLAQAIGNRASGTVLVLLPEILIVADNQEKAIMYLQTRMEMLAGRIWMDGRREIKTAGVIQNNLLNLVETWIINIKQDSAALVTQEKINQTDHRQGLAPAQEADSRNRAQVVAAAEEAAVEEAAVEEVAVEEAAVAEEAVAEEAVAEEEAAGADAKIRHCSKKKK